MASCDAREYWDQRLAETYAVDGVSYEHRGAALNGWMFRVHRQVFLRARCVRCCRVLDGRQARLILV